MASGTVCGEDGEAEGEGVELEARGCGRGELLVLLWAMEGDLEVTLKKLDYALLGAMLVVESIDLDKSRNHTLMVPFMNPRYVSPTELLKVPCAIKIFGELLIKL